MRAEPGGIGVGLDGDRQERDAARREAWRRRSSAPPRRARSRHARARRSASESPAAAAAPRLAVRIDCMTSAGIEPHVRRPAGALAEQRAGGVANPRAAIRPAAVYPDIERLWHKARRHISKDRGRPMGDTEANGSPSGTSPIPRAACRCSRGTAWRPRSRLPRRRGFRCCRRAATPSTRRSPPRSR